MPLNGKKILLGITGSIAAYKAVELCRLLTKQNADVRVIMTPSACDFVTPLTFSAISKKPVLVSMISGDQTWNNHIEAGLWADILMIAPASANTIASLANGICNNMLHAVYLSARCPVMIAPAMDHDMYVHPATQNNIDILKQRGHSFIGPAHGELASGITGEGRMEEPENLLAAITGFFLTGNELKGKKVLVTAGPTREAIDAIRFISNRSSGKMGFAIAEEMMRRGAHVTLIAGPNQLMRPHHLDYIPVESAAEMYQACMEHFSGADIAIMSAAVSDFTPANPESRKIKKEDASLDLRLQRTGDILLEMGKKKRNGQLLIGFALESGQGLENAKDKLHRKNLDLIVLNTLADKGAGFDTETNKVTLIDKSGSKSFGLKSKSLVACDIVDKIVSITHA